MFMYMYIYIYMYMYMYMYMNICVYIHVYTDLQPSTRYPARETLQQVYSAYLNAVLCSRLPKHPDWGAR